MLPSFTRPPRRMRAPGAICFSTTSVGELKKTIEPSRAVSTRPTASTSTARAEPIRTSGRCLRVIESVVASLLPRLSYASRSAVEAQPFGQLIDPPELVGLGGKRATRLPGGRERPLTLAEHHIGAHQPEPSFDVGTVLAETLGQPVDHTLDHGDPLVRRQIGAGGDLILARTTIWTATAWSTTCAAGHAHQLGAHELRPRRIGRRAVEQCAPRRNGLAHTPVLFRRQTEEEARLDMLGVERERGLECRQRLR